MSNLDETFCASRPDIRPLRYLYLQTINQQPLASQSNHLFQLLPVVKIIRIDLTYFVLHFYILLAKYFCILSLRIQTFGK